MVDAPGVSSMCIAGRAAIIASSSAAGATVVTASTFAA